MNVKTAIIPCAGEGSRWRPYSQVVPKELLPVFNQAAIDVVITECLSNGIKTFIFVTSSSKDYLNWHLSSKDINFTLVNQEEPAGLANAILQADEFVYDDHFMVVLPDMIFKKDWLRKALLNLPESAENLILLHKTNLNVNAYGVANPDMHLEAEYVKIREVVEKPKNLVGNQAVISGRYIFNQSLFKHLKRSPTNDLTSYLNSKSNATYGYLSTDLIGDVGTVDSWYATINKLWEGRSF